MRKSAYERLLEKVVIDEMTGCWLFQGARDQNGHGNVRFKRENGKWSCEKAHRVSYRHHKGEPPPGNVLRHTCDVANCVNPEHLIPGTQKMNVYDMIVRDRLRNQYGPCTGHVDLTEALIEEELDDCPF